MTTAIAHIKLAKQGIIQEGSWGVRDLGEHGSTMTLHQDKDGLSIEWDFPSLETTAAHWARDGGHARRWLRRRHVVPAASLQVVALARLRPREASSEPYDSLDLSLDLRHTMGQGNPAPNFDKRQT